jgi:hypothetical protein
MIVASLLMLVGVFAKPLGIPSNLEMLPMLGAGVCFLVLIRLAKKAKAAGQLPVLPESQKKKRFAFVVTVLAMTCISGPFVLPSTGVKASFQVWVWISVATFVFCTTLVWLVLWGQTSKGNAEEGPKRGDG